MKHRVHATAGLKLRCARIAGQVALPVTARRRRKPMPSVRKRGSVLVIQSYIRLKLLTGLRRSDLLRLQVSSCREDGIHVRTNKTGKAVIYTWTPELRAAIEGAKAARPVHIAPFLFPGRKGQGYVDEETGLCSGWKSMWQRFMDRVLRETKVTERITEHDLRAKCASDADSLEHARPKPGLEAAHKTVAP